MSFQIKNYIIDRKRIGKGSFSTIYKGKNTKNNNIYAIKEIIIDKNKNKNIIKREFNVLKKLNHPNIIKLHDVIIDTSFQNIYFIMDYHELGDLTKFLNKRPLKEKYCKKYLRQLSYALKYLLENNILHRDLKPQNILMSVSHNIIVTDFGFARTIQDNMLITTLCGSPMYMAPEIFNRQTYNTKSDLWSVGIIMYEMIYGHTPYKVSNFIELVKKINNEKIKYDTSINITINCLNLLNQLIEIDVNKRIEWEDFFNHRWFEKDEILNNENNLLEINVDSIPHVNRFKLNENVFCSYTHKSIIHSEELTFNLVFDNNDNTDNVDSIDSFNSDLYISANSNLDSITSNEIHSITSKEIDSNNEIKNIIQQAVTDNDINSNSNSNDIDIDIYIDIDNQNSTSLYINDYEIIENTMNISPNKLDTDIYDNDIYDNDNNNNTINRHIQSTSLPINNYNNTISESFKHYLYSSINILKHSYKYINNKSI